MVAAKQILEKELPAIIEKGYQQACYYFEIIPVKQVIFKGFFGEKIYQQVLDNQEILTNLGVDAWQEKHFATAVRKLEQTKSGITFPAKHESWIILNTIYYQQEYSLKLIMKLVEIIAHETSHAVLFNIDIWRGHDFPHEEITKYLKNYLLMNYQWEKILKIE